MPRYFRDFQGEFGAGHTPCHQAIDSPVPFPTVTNAPRHVSIVPHSPAALSRRSFAVATAIVRMQKTPRSQGNEESLRHQF